jgi:hypothetical protein
MSSPGNSNQLCGERTLSCFGVCVRQNFIALQDEIIALIIIYPESEDDERRKIAEEEQREHTDPESIGIRCFIKQNIDNACGIIAGYLLLEKGAKLETKANYAKTPLLWAVASGHEAVVKLLLEKGAKLETKDTSHGQTLLSLAAASGHEAVVKLLLEKGAELESKDNIEISASRIK